MHKLLGMLSAWQGGTVYKLLLRHRCWQQMRCLPQQQLHRLSHTMHNMHTTPAADTRYNHPHAQVQQQCLADERPPPVSYQDCQPATMMHPGIG
jgi:hypothetical protein